MMLPDLLTCCSPGGVGLYLCILILSVSLAIVFSGPLSCSSIKPKVSTGYKKTLILWLYL